MISNQRYFKVFGYRKESFVPPPQIVTFNPKPFSRSLFQMLMIAFITIEQIELQAKLLNYFSGSNKSNINQYKVV